MASTPQFNSSATVRASTGSRLAVSSAVAASSSPRPGSSVCRRRAGSRPIQRSVSSAVAAADKQADSVTHFSRLRVGRSSLTKSAVSTSAREPSSFSRISRDASPWPEKWTTSQPGASIITAPSFLRVTPYCNTRSSTSRPRLRVTSSIRRRS